MKGEVRKGLHPIWKFHIEFLRAQSDFLLEFWIIAIMGHQLEPFVSLFKSLKKGVGNKFLTPFNSHFMQIPIIAIIEFLGIAVAYFYNAGV